MDTLALIKRHTSAQLNDRGVKKHVCGEKKGAFHLYAMAISMDPTYYLSYFNAGNLLRGDQRFEQARYFYEKSIRWNPEFLDAYRNIAPIYRHLGLLAEAKACYEMILTKEPDDPTARHYVTALEGGESHRPAPFVEELFDGCAANFDRHLLDKLHYRVPKMLLDFIHQQGDVRFDRVLDLGCGTGLLGEPLRKVARELVGVDISKNMLAEAHRKSIYDQLVSSEICDYLENQPSLWDVVLICDVLLYLGSLDKLFDLLGDAIKIGGILIISIDEGELTEGYALQSSGRYCHSRPYIEGLCGERGMKISNTLKEVVRQQGGDSSMASFLILERVKMPL